MASIHIIRVEAVENLSNFQQDSGYGANIGANIGGKFFGGAYFPQKWDLLPPFQPRFKLFQGHVLSY
jgi:hypothetical protein